MMRILIITALLFFISVSYVSNVYAGDIQVTMQGSVNSITAGAVYLTGTATGAPEASATNNATNSTSITTNINVLTNGAWLIDVVASGDSGSFAPGAGQNERWDLATGGNGATGAMSTKPISVAGADSATQIYSASANRLAHAVISIAPDSSIAFDSVSSNSNTNNATINWTHTFSTGDPGKLIVGVGIEEGNGCSSDRIVNSVTYDGTPLTFITAIDENPGSFCNRVELWYLDIAQITDIQVTMTGQVSELIAGAVALTGAATGNPEATATNSVTGNQNITTNITTLTNNAWLVDAVSAGSGGSFNFISGQTEQWDVSTGGATGSSSTKPVATAGPSSMTRTHSQNNTNRIAHAVMSVAPDTTIALDSVTSSSSQNVSSLSWSHSVTDPSAKLIVGIAVEGSNGECGSGNQVVSGVTYAGKPLTFVTAITVSTSFCNRVELWYLDLKPASTVNLDAYYRMDETWTVPAASVVLDYSGNGNHGDTIASGTGTQISNGSATPAIAGNPGTCGYGVFPANTGDAQHHAVDSKLTPGDTGSVSFWYSADSDWVGSGNLKLLDASSSLTSRFFLTKMNNGALRFRLEDAAGTATQAQTAVQSFLAGEWVHIGITWDMTNDQTEIYINGALSATSTTTVTTAAAWNSLYIGDNRIPGVTGTGNTPRSAAGLIDEVRIYDGVIDSTQVNSDYISTHPCTLIDHYQIQVISGSPSVCEPITIKITAHDVTDGAINVNALTVLNFSTSSGTGIWTSLIAGTGTWSPSGINNGIASYTWPGGESSLQVTFSQTSAVTENINLDDGAATDLSGNAFEDPDIDFGSGPLIRITTDGSDQGSINTEIAGKNSNVAPAQTLYIQLKQSGVTFFGQDACEVPGAYNGNQTVRVAAECVDPSTCAGQQVSINGNTINTYDTGSVPASAASWTGVTMNFDGSGTSTTDNKASFYFNYPDAGLMKLYFELPNFNPTGPGTPNLTFTGTSNTFVVRPFGFRIDGFSPANPAAVDENGGIFTKAGKDFTVNITAVVWQSADDDGSTCNLTANPACLANDGIPDSNSSLSGNLTTPNFGNESTAVIANISHSLRAPVNASAQQGTLTGSGNVSGFVSGVINNHTMSWDEVGIIQLDVNESNNDYLGGGQDVIGLVPYLGRFTPANLTVQVLGTAKFEDSCSTGAFTYLDQTFYYGPAANDAPRIRVRGVDANGNITFNYDSGNGAGGFWKLNSTTLPRVYTDAAGAAATLDPPIAGVTQDTDVTYQNMGNYNGFVNLRLDRQANGDPFLYQRVSPEAPFNASVNLTFNAAGLIDDDGICYDGDSDGICDGTTPTPLSTDDDFVYGNITGTELRFGRLVFDNAFGSELLTLNVPIRAEYFDGDDFVTNAVDDCSTYKASDVTLSDVTGADSLVPGDTAVSSPASVTTLVNGEFDPANPIILDAPGAGKTGSLDVLLDLSTATGSGQEWLRYDWDGDGNYDNDPTARATWGIYSGSDELIYIREPW